MVTKEAYSSSDLIRFVCDPNGNVIPDVAAKLPGRGCWVFAERNILNKAVEKNIFLRFGYKVFSSTKHNSKDIEDLDSNENYEEVKIKKKPVSVKDDLVDQIEELLLKRCLDYIGLANRSGNIVSGFEKVKAVLKSNKTNILLTAFDGADNGRNKMCQGLDNIQIIDMFTRKELSQATGLENAVHLALLPGGISISLLREISRYGRCKKTVII